MNFPDDTIPRILLGRSLVEAGRWQDAESVLREADTEYVPAHDGLRNMDKRLTDVGGCCRVTSTPGQGTTIRLIVPVSSLNVHREK